MNCDYCEQHFKSKLELDFHHSEHKRSGDITKKEIRRDISNELDKVVAETKKCNLCQDLQMWCEFHNYLISVLQNALRNTPTQESQS